MSGCLCVLLGTYLSPSLVFCFVRILDDGLVIYVRGSMIVFSMI